MAYPAVEAASYCASSELNSWSSPGVCLWHDHAERHERDNAAVTGHRWHRRLRRREHSNDGRRGRKRTGLGVVRWKVRAFHDRGDGRLFAARADRILATRPSCRASHLFAGGEGARDNRRGHAFIACAGFGAQREQYGGHAIGSETPKPETERRAIPALLFSRV